PLDEEEDRQEDHSGEKDAVGPGVNLTAAAGVELLEPDERAEEDRPDQAERRAREDQQQPARDEGLFHARQLGAQVRSGGRLALVEDCHRGRESYRTSNPNARRASASSQTRRPSSLRPTQSREAR